MQRVNITSGGNKTDGGRDGIRTHDPGVANAVLSQLSYSPVPGTLRFNYTSGDGVGSTGWPGDG